MVVGIGLLVVTSGVQQFVRINSHLTFQFSMATTVVYRFYIVHINLYTFALYFVVIIIVASCCSGCVPSEFTTFLATRKVEFMSWQFMEHYLPLIHARRIGLSTQRDLV